MKNRSDINRFIRIIGIFFLAVGIIALIVYDYHDVPKYSYTYIGPGGRDMTEELSEGVLITQEIPYYAGDKGLSFIFSTYGHQVSGEVSVQAVGEQSGLVYFERTTPGKEFQNNEFEDFFFSEEISAADETLAVSFTGTSEPGSGLSVLTTGTDSIPGLDLTIDEVKIETDLMVRRVVTDGASRFLRIIMGAAIVVGGIIVVILKLRKLPLEVVYVIVAIFLGILYMFIMTPLAIPDERTHYTSAYNLANRFLFTDIGVGEKQYFDFSGFGGHITTRTGYDRILNDFFKSSEPENTIGISQSGLSYPLMYLPQAIGITIGRLFHLNFMLTFFLGRFCNLFFFVICVFYAIHIAPRSKLLLCMVGLMPMALHQAASYSYDVFINGLSILLLAEVLKLRETCGQRQIIEFLPVTIIIILLCPAKPVYVFLAFLLLLVPSEKVGSIKKYALIVGVVIVLTAITILLFQSGGIFQLMLKTQNNIGIENVETNTHMITNYYPVSFVLSHPVETVKIFLNTLRSNEMWFKWLLESIGRTLAGLNLQIDEWCIVAYLVILTISSFTYQEPAVKIHVSDRVLLLFVSASVVGAVMLVMFIGWTPYGNPVIEGVQGRYFIPILPLLFLSLSNDMIKLQKPIEKVLALVSLFLNLAVLNQVLLITLKG